MFFAEPALIDHAASLAPSRLNWFEEPTQDVPLVVAPATDLPQQLKGVDTRAVIVVPDDVQSPCAMERRILNLQSGWAAMTRPSDLSAFPQ